MKWAKPTLLVLLMTAATLAACGGEGGKGGGNGSETTAPDLPAGGAQRESHGGGGTRKNLRQSPKGSYNARDEAKYPPRLKVDLRVRPKSIRGAMVTPLGAVQTLSPSEAAHRIAEENGYPSINSYGAEATGQEVTEITFALVQYLTAKADGDWMTACARLYSVLRENLERGPEGRPSGNCPTVYEELMQGVPRASRVEQAQIDVSSVRRGEGNRAFVVYKTPDTLSADMPMYLEGGVWKVGAIDAYVLRAASAG